MIVTDVETTGVNPEVHGIIAIGAVEFENPSNEFFIECHVPTGMDIQLEALQVNGYNIEDLRNPEWRPDTIESAVRKFSEWSYTCADRTLAGINPSFDKNFLTRWSRRAEVGLHISHRTVDLHTEIFSIHKRNGWLVPVNEFQCTSMTTDFIHPFVGLPEEPKPHHALNGARFETEAFHRAWFRRSLYDFWPESVYPVPDYLINAK